jgi:hypothetical protein
MQSEPRSHGLFNQSFAGVRHLALRVWSFWFLRTLDAPLKIP